MLKRGNFIKYIDNCVWILKYNASCVRFETAFVVILTRQGCQFSKIILVQVFENLCQLLKLKKMVLVL